MKRTKSPSISSQVKRKVMQHSSKQPPKYDGDIGIVTSTGSTLLDLAISGGRVKGGGVPAGILVEIFGPASSGKTVLLSEIAGGIQRKGGEVTFHDPEARLNKQFARIFDLDINKIDYGTPDTVTEVFERLNKWRPKPEKASGKTVIHGIFADSLAALSTDLELSDKGDKMGTRRAKEFSEGLRKYCRTLTQKKYLMVCSNQLRQNIDAGQFEQKFTSPGGEAVKFYSSLRLRTFAPEKIWVERTIRGKIVKRVIGVKTRIEVFKSSVWKPYHFAPLHILFDYGIDDIRANLQFIKDFSKNTIYTVNEQELDKGMNASILLVEEEEDLEQELKKQVIDLWEDIESKFEIERKPKRR